MIQSFFKFKMSSSVIVASLVVGITSIQLIGVFILHELNTDNFHADKDRIFALQSDDPWAPGSKMYHSRFGSAEYMKNNFEEVEDFCRINNATPQKVLVNNEAYFDKPKVISASPNFFDFFSYKLLTNNHKSALETENCLVISEDLEKKYFGSSSALGHIITLVNREKEEQMVVTGIFQKPTDNTQILFDMVRPIKDEDSRCYIKISQTSDPTDLERQFELNKAIIPVIHTGTPGQFYLENLHNTYFDTSRRSTVEASRDKKDLMVALIIGIMILGIASFNFLGQIKIKLYEKTNEFRIRRINGGSKISLIYIFMSEILMLFGISILLFIPLFIWINPYFNQLVGSYASEHFIFHIHQIFVLIVIVLILVLITLLFSVYHIKHKISIEIQKSEYIKSNKIPAFNILQLASSIVLIVCSFIVVKQINYITNKPIGMDKDVIEIKIPASYSPIASVFKEELLSNSFINQVSIATASPVLEHFLVSLEYLDGGVEKKYAPAGFSGDEHYINTLGIEIIAGSGYSGNPLADKNKCLINQSLAELFGNNDLIGKPLPGMPEKIVVGIVKDFHYSSLKSLVEPAFISYNNSGRNLLVKVAKQHHEEAIAVIGKIWNQLIPDYPLSIESIGTRYEWLHRENEKYAKFIGTCCLISLFLSMMGLYVICFNESNRRTKEIGVRKVNGAKIWEIMAMLNQDFVKWMAISFIIASPIAWYAMNKWLQNFAYKTEMSWWIFGLAGLIALGIALLTVSFQSWKAANRNPIESLRYE